MTAQLKFALKILGCLLLFALGSYIQQAHAQADIIATNRKVDWALAGVKGGIPYRTRVCSTLTSANTLAQINSAIAACPAHQVVLLQNGTYNLSGGILFDGKSNVTLRGQSTEGVILNFSSSHACNGLGASICVRSSALNDLDSPGNTTNWTAGYSKGTTVVTLASVTNLQVGSPIIFDRINDSTTDNNAVWMCRTAPSCCYDCATPSRNSGGLRSQSQISIVTAINGTNVTIEPAIAWPNFTSGATDPEAWYPNGPAVTKVGIENLTINTESATGGSSVMFANASYSWMRGVKVIHLGEKGVWLYQTVGIEVVHSYFYDKQGTDASQEGSESYGVNDYIASNTKVHQNIFHHMTSPLQCENGVGRVAAYNYTFDDFYNLTNSDWAQASSYTHGACAYILYEGNIGFGMIQDVVHSGNFFHTGFRNRWEGWETGRSLQTVAVHIYAPNRYSNVIGNVLGTDSYHTKRLSSPSSAADCDTSIYAIGFGGNCGNGSVANKTNVLTSTMIWGNYDTVTDGNVFNSAEVPSGDANYPNTVPANNNLPTSFFLTKRPIGYGSTAAWPPIGPDVTGGDISSVGGHANSIPAKLCWDNGTKVSGILTFVPGTCFPVTAPQNLQ